MKVQLLHLAHGGNLSLELSKCKSSPHLVQIYLPFPGFSPHLCMYITPFLLIF